MINIGSCYYDEAYRHGKVFSYRRWLYKPFLRALVGKANLRAGCSVLDVGCGQGFFSQLIADLGFKPLGIDLSAEGIRLAEEDYGSTAARFEVGEALSLDHKGEFDCVFARGLSLYNCKNLEQTHEVTKALLEYLRPGGVMIFAYGTILCPRKRSESWMHHSLSDARKYFSSYPGAKVYFSLRIETLLFGSWAFSLPFTFSSALISRIVGVGGDLIALVPRSSLERT
ncbi:MAG: class I SAM-dependent methyltransferase [Acidobacteriia bacterium]|nr:class I SAM-dependent methyltransferase [Terriglobia bacterium]